MGVANNSEYREIAFDSFEDYRTTDNCAEDHFSFRGSGAIVVQNEAHSGRDSVKVSAGSTSEISVTKLIEVCDEE